MWSRRARDVTWIVAAGCVILAGFAWAEFQRTGGQWGAPLDDVYIHFQFARNLATGRGFGFEPNHPTPGSTAPLWVLILAPWYRFLGALLLPARAISALTYLGTAIATYALASTLLEDRQYALLAGILTALSGRLAWAGMSGMETTLFTLVTLLAIWRHSVELRAQRPPWGSVALLGIASLLRPEAYLLFALAFLDRWLYRWQRRGHGSWQRWLGLELGAAALYAAFVLPYLAFSYRTTGHLLPNTFRVVTGDVHLPPLRYGYKFITRVWQDHAFLALLAPVGLVILVRRTDRTRLLPLAWAVGLPLVSAWVAPRLRHHGRYVMPLIPLYIVLGLAGLAALVSRLERLLQSRGWSRHIYPLSIALVLLVSLPVTYRWADEFGWNVDNINEMHVALGEWVRENTPPGTLVAANDIGAIGYLSGREIVDTVGLVSPETIDVLVGQETAWERDVALVRYLSNRRPDLAILLPNWYRALTPNDQVLEPVHRIELAHNTICGGDEMVVYLPHWPYLEEAAVQTAVNADLGTDLRLLGFDLQPEVPVPGSPVQLTLYWSSRRTTDTSYKVFVHLVDTTEQIWAQHDGEPVGGMAPTNVWQPGDVVRDEHVLLLPGDLPDGDYFLLAGLYDRETMARLDVRNGPDGDAGRVLLSEVQVSR